MKKYSKHIATILTIIGLVTPAFAAAQTATSSDISSQVQLLMSQIQSLEAQLRTLVSSVATGSMPMMPWNAASSTVSASWGGQATSSGMQMPCGGFDRNLSIGSQGDDVTQLQQMLSGEGFLQASSTGYFGPLTARALGAFQAHFGIATSSGFFGPMTRTFMAGRCGEAASSTSDMSAMQRWGEGMTGSSTWSGGYNAGGPMIPYNASSSAGMPVAQPCAPMNGMTSSSITANASSTSASGMYGNPCHGSMMPPPGTGGEGASSSSAMIPGMSGMPTMPMMPARVQGQSQ